MSAASATFLGFVNRQLVTVVRQFLARKFLKVLRGKLFRYGREVATLLYKGAHK